MPTFSLFTVYLITSLAPPAPTDREVAPVDVAAPEASPAPSPSPAPSSSSPSSPSGAPAASDPTQFGVAPPPAVTAKPAPPPPAPAPRKPELPIRWRADVMVALGTAVFRDPAWRAFDSDRSVLHGSLTLRADKRMGTGRLFLGGGATVRAFAARGTPYEVFTTRISVREPIAFVRLSAMMVQGVDLFAQLGGGVSIVDLAMASTVTTSQRSVVGLADGLGGITLYLPRRWLERQRRVTGGLELGAGYTWRGDVDVRPRVDTEEDPITTDSVSLGDVSLRGVTWRLGVFLRFQ